MKKVFFFLLCLFPCLLFFSCSSKNSDWDVENMVLAKEPEEKPENENVFMTIVMEKSDQGRVFWITFDNPNLKLWSGYDKYRLDVLINRKWYCVPYLDNDAYASVEVTVGLKRSKTFELPIEHERAYGKLPKGHYRIVYSNLAAEFDIAE